MTSTSHPEILLLLKVGVPLSLLTEGGLPFTSTEFNRFTEHWGVHHMVTSPNYPQSNGHAEAAVKAAKHLILKTTPTSNFECEEFDRGLLELRNTPSPTGRSPAQSMYGRPLRTCVPTHPDSFSEEDCVSRAASQTDQVQPRYNEHARPLLELSVGQPTQIQDRLFLRWDKVGVLMTRKSTSRAGNSGGATSGQCPLAIPTRPIPRWRARGLRV
ncbi:uncharacterized protein LOC143030441 [Oratosquilla oratoria]|uniref:uncharacterized protein LOC143030441 n=1 Tax=Oratosquilla oratoria TaxID=337810 RepID=UPI003F76340E